jgi:LuxR family transcriptional regulator, maltose regulon positive regulatory protein
MAALSDKSLVSAYCAEYLVELIHNCSHFICNVPIENENLPWLLKISTLGRFELSLNGAPERFSGKVQRKPLLLLKALIALGGKDVKEDVLADLLWPEADGDQAHSAYTKTVFRLRRFIGHEKVIVIHEGRASLNPRYCRVDIWTFEEILDQIEGKLKELGEAGKGKSGVNEEITELAEKASRLYGGHLLPGEGNQSWVLPLRERLNRRFYRFIIRIGGYFEAMDQWEKAAEYYHNAVEIGKIFDEELFQKLMICHHRLGQPARAVEVYHCCKNRLLSTFGIKPSLKTEAIHRALLM